MQLENELIARLDRVIVIAGIGVSLATCDSHPCATWKGLLLDGLQRCQDVCGTDATLIDTQRAILTNPKSPTHSLIGVGQFITEELKAHRSGVFGAWLNESIGEIPLIDARLVAAIASLGAKLATTNYDNMIGFAASLTPITWRDKARGTLFFREPTQDVLHLHGHYLQPESVILGGRSYGDICGDEYFQTILRSWMFSGTLVFIGCGSGLEDPNFGALLEWAKKTLTDCHHSHFILVRSKEVNEWRGRLKGMTIEPVSYGSEYSDLTPFISNLAKRTHDRRVREPYSLLQTSQVDFDVRWKQLETNREQYSAQDYFNCSRILAAELWRAGGRRLAAMEFSVRINHQGQDLLVSDYVEFALCAAEWLLEEEIASLAINHLRKIGQCIGNAGIPQSHISRFRQLQLRCMNALCAYTEALRVIEEALPHVDATERNRLLAERSEMHFLQGNFTQAVAD